MQRQGERFAERILGPNELAMFRQRRARVEARGLRYLATRFAAKEAFSKAIGLGLHAPMTWRACETLNQPGGQPALKLHGALASWFEAQGWRAHVTLTDETDYAVAFVVVEAVAPLLPPAIQDINGTTQALRGDPHDNIFDF